MKTFFRNDIQGHLAYQFQKKYRPAFSVKETDWGFWLCDHGRPMALYYNDQACLDVFESGSDSQRVVEYEIRPHYDFSAILGCRLSLIRDPGYAEADVTTVIWEEAAGDRLTLKATTRFGDESRLEQRVIVGVLNGTDRYVIRLEGDLWLKEPKDMELFNFLPGGLGLGNPNLKRYQAILSQTLQGELIRESPSWVNNFGITRLRSHRMKYWPEETALGVATDGDWNPCCLLLSASAPAKIATCDQWFDQHLILSLPGSEAWDGEFFRGQLQMEWLNLPQPLAEEMKAAARPLTVGKDETDSRNLTPFSYECRNDFSQPVIPDDIRSVSVINTSESTNIVWKPAPPENAGDLQCLAWDDEVAYRGTRSLRIHGLRDHELWFVPPYGSYRVESGRTVKVEGWVRTRGSGRAALVMLACNYRWTEASALWTKTNLLECDQDWSFLEASFLNPGFNYVQLGFLVAGESTAWFDDVQFGLAPLTTDRVPNPLRKDSAVLSPSGHDS